jgi:hypothetical protein
MRRILHRAFPVIILSLILFATCSFAAEGVDDCAKEGIAVENLTMLDLWYKKDGGDCFIWVHGHVLFIKPDEVINIFSDLSCKTQYCKKHPSYKEYKAVDANGNCEVRILPDCSVSDN